MTVVMSFCGLCLLVALGKFLRVRVRFLQLLYLPSSVIAGLLGLIVIQVCGARLPPAWTAGWGALPGLLINVVFAALFLGVSIPPLAQVWKRAAPQLAYGQIVAWGQYVVGVGLVLLVLRPVFGVSSLFGVVVPVGFEGGHGTAGGLGPTFVQLNWAEGVDFCLASATAGIVSAVVVGMVLVNWAIRRGYVTTHVAATADDPYALSGVYPVDARPEAGRQTVSPSSIDALALHLAVIGIAILIGFGLRECLILLELQIPGLANNDIKIMRAFPLFPLCMIGGLIVQLSVTKFARVSPIDHGLMQRVGGTALDFLVVAAISTIRIEVIAENWIPFVLIIVGGILWNVFCVMWLARRVLPNCWFERAIAEMGQSMGITATGLLLLRAVDPESKTEAASAFGYKQLLHEPFMGGGLWTSSAVLVVAAHGGGVVLAISAGAIAAWLTVWWVFLKGAE
jgi:glutamate:Na+ symporter, ESS family